MTQLIKYIYGTKYFVIIDMFIFDTSGLISNNKDL